MEQDLTPEQLAAEEPSERWTPGMRVAGMLGWLIKRYENGLTSAEARELLRGIEELAHELKDDAPAIAFVRDPSADDDDGHPDARVQQGLDALDEALADWSYDGGFPNRAYFLLLATKDADGSGFRSVSRHEMTVEQAVAVEQS